MSLLLFTSLAFLTVVAANREEKLFDAIAKKYRRRMPKVQPKGLPKQTFMEKMQSRDWEREIFLASALWATLLLCVLIKVTCFCGKQKNSKKRRRMRMAI